MLFKSSSGWCHGPLSPTPATALTSITNADSLEVRVLVQLIMVYCEINRIYTESEQGSDSQRNRTLRKIQRTWETKCKHTHAHKVISSCCQGDWSSRGSGRDVAGNVTKEKKMQINEIYDRKNGK